MHYISPNFFVEIFSIFLSVGVAWSFYLFWQSATHYRATSDVYKIYVKVFVASEMAR